MKGGSIMKQEKEKPVAVYKLMDFNQAFHSYDDLDDILAWNNMI